MSNPTKPSTPVEDAETMPGRLRSALNGAALSHDGKPTGFAAISISLLGEAADRLDALTSDRERLQAALTAAEGERDELIRQIRAQQIGERGGECSTAREVGNDVKI